MSGRPFSFPGRVGYWLICLAVIGALTGCGPKLTPSMSDEDLQTCDDSTAKMKQWSDVSMPSSNAQPYLVTPGEVDITSPLYGSILPYGKQVVIKFKQPPANAGVLYRNYRILVTSITGSNLDRVGDQYAVVTQPPTDFQVTWTPPGSGKYILVVLIRNLETIAFLGGNTEAMGEQLQLKLSMMEDFDIHYGPFSLAYVCVKIDVPKAGEAIPPQPGTIMPLQNVTNLAPTITRTATLLPTITKTFTFTPFIPTATSTFTSTPFIPTFTSTFTSIPPTRVPPTDIPPTDIPSTPAVICSNFTDERSCVANDACRWEIPPTGGPGVCKDKQQVSYTGLEPAELAYHTNPYGKLYLPSHPLKFNLSRSRNRAVFAFPLEKEIGVDIEQVHPLEKLDHMVKRWFSPTEQTGLFALAPEMQMDAFFHVWTQKDAFLKAHGEGLSHPLQDFSVSVDPNKPGGVLSIRDGAGDVSGWKMYTHVPSAGWRVAVCVRSNLDSEVFWYKPKLADFVSSVTSGKTPLSI